MKKISMLVVLAVALAMAGCTNGNQTQTAPSASPAASPVVTQAQEKPEKKIEKISGDTIPAEWTTLGVAEHDVISDGNTDIISLRTSAQREDGELLLDDSQEWALTVQTLDGIYPLYREHTHGTLYMDVSEFYMGIEAVPVITLYILTGAGTEIRQYRYRDGEFYETTVYSTQNEADGGINRIYTSIPAYQ